MDTHDYSIAGILKELMEHAEHVNKANEEQLSKWIEMYPDTPVPDALARPWNLSRAFAVMAFEIQLMKLKMGCD